MSFRSKRFESYVYFIACGKCVKIGSTYNPDHRLKTFQAGNPYKMRLLYALVCEDREIAYAIEEKVHQFFNEYRIHGEWFEWSAQNERLLFESTAREIVFLEKFDNIPF